MSTIIKEVQNRCEKDHMVLVYQYCEWMDRGLLANVESSCPVVDEMCKFKSRVVCVHVSRSKKKYVKKTTNTCYVKCLIFKCFYSI